MGGYNTLCEIASFAKPALVVPRVQPRYEQAMRAKLWDGLGLLKAAEPAALKPQGLSGQVCDLLDNPFVPDRSRLDMGALDRIAERFSAIWNGERVCEASLRM